jgi:phosphate transport system substrate-binding protein
MAYTRGRCTNFDYCLLADARRDVEVLVGQEFVCPQCGKPLRAPPVGGDEHRWAVIAMIGLGAVTLLSGALYLGIRLGESARRAVPVAPPAAVATVPHPMSAVAATVPAPAPAPAPAPQVPPSVLMRVAGSPDMAGLVGALAAAYLSQSGDSDVKTADGPQSGQPGMITISGQRGDNREEILIARSSATEGFKVLAGGGANMVMSARRLLPEEQDALRPSLGDMEAPAAEHVVALDALAVVVNPANTLGALRLDQVRAVFGGTIKDWAAVGGGGGSIHRYVVRAPSELRERFAALAMAGLYDAANTDGVADVADVAAAVAGDPHGIGVVDLPNVGPLHALAIGAAGYEAVPPTNKLAVQVGDYPLSYPLYLYNSDTASDMISQRFLAFATSPDGQKIVARAGLVSPSMPPETVAVAPASSERLKRFVAGARRLPIEFHFLPNSNDLDLNGEHDLDHLADLLKANQITGDRLILAGFSDNHQGPRASQALAKGRADAVAALLARDGLAPLRAAGFGQESPVADNGSEDGRARNRRVEVYLLP